MAGRVRAALKVRPGEGGVVVRLLAMMFVGMAGAAVGATGVESLFFSRYGTDAIPGMYLAVGPLTCVVMLGLSVRLSGDALRLLLRLPLAIAVGLVVARGVLALDLEWFYPVLWLVMMVLWTSQMMGSWGIAGAVSDTRQAKRLFPLYGVGLIAGSALGGLVTGPLAALVQTENLLLVWAGTAVAAALLARSVVRGRVPVRKRRGRRERPPLEELTSGVRDLWRSPLLRSMATSIVLFGFLYFLLTFLFARAATARFPATEDLAGFLGLFMGTSSVAGLLTGLLVANRLFARFGIPAMMAVLALVYVAGYAAVGAGASFVVLVGFRFVQVVWVNAVWATGWQALFNVVPPEHRPRTRSLMDAGPMQLGVMLAGAVLIAADRAIGSDRLYLVGIAAAALAVWSTWRVRRAYGGALVEALRAGNPDVFRTEAAPFGSIGDDAAATAVVTAGVADPDPAVRRLSMAILGDVASPAAEPALVAGLEDPDAAIRSAAVQALARAGRAPAVRTLLGDPDPDVRAGAAGVLLPAEDAHDVLVAMSEDGRASWRSAAAAFLGRDPERLAVALTDPDPSVRRAAANAAGDERGIAPLIEALGDADPSVRDAAARSLAGIGAPARAELLRAMGRTDLEAGALSALANFAGPLPPELRRLAHDRAAAARRYHREWLAARSDGDERMAFLAHCLRFRAVDLATRALRAVSGGRNPDAMATAIENLSSRDPQQRANALETLEAIGDTDLIRPLLGIWEGGNGSSTGPPLLVTELLDDPDPWVRACAVAVARSLDGVEPARIRSLADSDPDPLVREAAAARSEGGSMETLSTLSMLERVMFLRKVPMFGELPPEDLKRIAEVATEHAYPDGEVIAEEGEGGDEMHIVVTGAIRVLTRRGTGETEIARREPGEFVGEMAIIDDAPRMASLVCDGTVRTLSLHRRNFVRILRERPDVSLGVMRNLCDRLRSVSSA